MDQILFFWGAAGLLAHIAGWSWAWWTSRHLGMTGITLTLAAVALIPSLLLGPLSAILYAWLVWEERQ